MNPNGLYLSSLSLKPEDFEHERTDPQGRHLWNDRLSGRFRLKCSDSAPWGKPWKLVVLSDRNSNRGQQDSCYRIVRRVTFTLFPIEEKDLIPIQLDRDVDAGQIIDTWSLTGRTWAVILRPSPPDNQLIYSIKPVKPVSQPAGYLNRLYEYCEGM
jgi:hypothetical protein